MAMCGTLERRFRLVSNVRWGFERRDKSLLGMVKGRAIRFKEVRAGWRSKKEVVVHEERSLDLLRARRG